MINKQENRMNWLAALPPIISLVHVFISFLLFVLGISLNIEATLYIGLPVILVVVLHTIVVIRDSSMGLSESIGYGLIHIPFCILLSTSSFLLFSLNTAV